jgi:hypothetical protein
MSRDGLPPLPPRTNLDAKFVAEFKALYDDTQPILLEISKYRNGVTVPWYNGVRV